MSCAKAFIFTWKITALAVASLQSREWRRRFRGGKRMSLCVKDAADFICRHLYGLVFVCWSVCAYLCGGGMLVVAVLRNYE